MSKYGVFSGLYLDIFHTVSIILSVNVQEFLLNVYCTVKRCAVTTVSSGYCFSARFFHCIKALWMLHSIYVFALSCYEGIFLVYQVFPGIIILIWDGDSNPSFTAKNTVISPNFLMWKFCGKSQFTHSFRRIAGIVEILPQYL